MSKFYKSAFPTKHYHERTGEMSHYESGMEFRDYVAAKALQGLITSDPVPGFNSPDSLAKEAYEFADAMLKARES